MISLATAAVSTGLASVRGTGMRGASAQGGADFAALLGDDNSDDSSSGLAESIGEPLIGAPLGEATTARQEPAAPGNALPLMTPVSVDDADWLAAIMTGTSPGVTAVESDPAPAKGKPMVPVLSDKVVSSVLAVTGAVASTPASADEDAAASRTAPIASPPTFQRPQELPTGRRARQQPDSAVFAVVSSQPIAVPVQSFAASTAADETLPSPSIAAPLAQPMDASGQPDVLAVGARPSPGRPSSPSRAPHVSEAQPPAVRVVTDAAATQASVPPALTDSAPAESPVAPSAGERPQSQLPALNAAVVADVAPTAVASQIVGVGMPPTFATITPPAASITVNRSAPHRPPSRALASRVASDPTPLPANPTVRQAVLPPADEAVPYPPSATASLVTDPLPTSTPVDGASPVPVAVSAAAFRDLPVASAPVDEALPMPVVPAAPIPSIISASAPVAAPASAARPLPSIARADALNLDASMTSVVGTLPANPAAALVSAVFATPPLIMAKPQPVRTIVSRSQQAAPVHSPVVESPAPVLSTAAAAPIASPTPVTQPPAPVTVPTAAVAIDAVAVAIDAAVAIRGTTPAPVNIALPGMADVSRDPAPARQSASAPGIPTQPAAIVSTALPLVPQRLTPLAGTVAPAGEVFAAAISAANRDSADPRDPAASTLSSLAATLAPVVAPAAAGDRGGASLDMRQGGWPAAMIDHIEKLRDAADAGDSRIRLVPDALGSIDVSLRRHDDGVQVTLVAHQPATQAMLADARPQLVAMAETRGIRLADTGLAASSGGDPSTAGGQHRQPSAPVPNAPARAATLTDDPDAADGRVA